MNQYNPETSNTPDVQVSPLSVKTLLNWPARIFAHTMQWFGPKSGHLNVGYASGDPATIARQVTFLKTRGVDFVLLEFYGTMAQPGVALAWKAECEKQGLGCAIGMDCGMFKPWDMPKGMDVNAWAKQQLDYVVANFFTSPMYEKTADGRFFMINFGWQTVTGLDAAAVLSGYPQIAMLWEHSTGVGKPHSAGGFAWVGVTGKFDPQKVIENYSADFLAKTKASFAGNSKQITAGSLARGFDDHNRQPGGDPTKSVWDNTAPYRWADEKQGQTFLNVVDIYNKSAFKPAYMQLVTLNDFEEGTALERGINSELAVSITAAQGVVTVALDGNLATVDHVDIYVNGEIVSTQQPAASLSFDLNNLSPINGQEYDSQAIAVGKPLFQNQASATVKTSATLIPGQTVQVPVHLDTSAVVHVSGVFQGLTVAGDLTVPVTQDLMVPATINTQILWSPQA